MTQPTKRRDTTYNESRRKKYADVPEYADKSRTAAREYYRKDNPLARKLSQGLLAEGQSREVIDEDMDTPVATQCFTIPEAAVALGRAELTINRWIADGLIPAPVLKDAVRGYRVYSTGELEIIAQVLATHEQEFSYLTAKHSHTIERLHQALFAYRSTYI